MTIDADRYAPAAQAFHWLSAILVPLAWAGDSFEMGEFTHVLAGEAIVALLFLRIGWRLIAPPPRAPTALGPFVGALGQFAHLALYALLIAVSASGVVTLFQGGEALPLAGLLNVASPWPRNREIEHYAKEIHETLAHGLVLLASVHALAALGRHAIVKDGVLKRMLPKSIA